MFVAFLVVPFLPSANIFFTVGFVIAERNLYISSLGFIGLIVFGAVILFEVETFRKVRLNCYILHHRTSLITWFTFHFLFWRFVFVWYHNLYPVLCKTSQHCIQFFFHRYLKYACNFWSYYSCLDATRYVFAIEDEKPLKTRIICFNPQFYVKTTNNNFILLSKLLVLYLNQWF